MHAIIKREWKNYLKNPIYWAGLIFILFELFQILNPYLQLSYFEPGRQIEAVDEEHYGDADITEGYVRSTAEEQFALACDYFSEELVKAFGVTEDEARDLITDVCENEKGLSIMELSEALMTRVWETYEEDWTDEPVCGFWYWYQKAEIHQGDAIEANAYMQKRLEEHSFSWYFSRKFADFCGLFLGFFSAVLLAFLFVRDTKRDTYELLHTKPVSAARYICGKAAGGYGTMLFAWGILTFVFCGLCEFYGRRHGFPVFAPDFLVTAAVYVLPNLLMITCIYTATALLFKNPLPAVPAVFLYMIYSNMGSQNAEGVYGYYGRPLAIMVRFPGRFFETAPPPLALLNQTFLLLASAVLLAVSVVIWKRRRVY